MSLVSTTELAGLGSAEARRSVVDNMPLVSVVIPTYNRASVIGRAVECVLAQTYQNIEVIVVDDGSTDNTHASLDGYGDKVKVIGQENRGPSAARNRGIMEAQGEIIAFLDSDDLWLPTKLERQVGLMERAGQHVPCCLCNATLRSENNEERSFAVSLLDSPYEEGLWLNPAEVLASRFVFFNQAVAVRSWALKQAGGYDETLRLLEDWDIALRLAVLGPWAFIQEPLAIWNPNGSGSLVTEARKNPIALKESALQLHNNALKNALGGNRRRLVRELKRKLSSTHRELQALRVGRMQFLGAAMIGLLLQKAERYRQAIVRRTPLFPRMKAAPLSADSNSQL